jgi:hypothetical protein
MARRAFLGGFLLGVALVGVAGMSSAAYGGSVFHSVDGCVLFDTRVAGGALEAREERTFHVVGSASDFVAQGGTAGGCGIPGFSGGQPVATAALINLTAIKVTGVGSLRVWPTDAAQPPTELVTFQKMTPQLNISNASVIAVRQDVEGADITIRANSAGVHVRGTVSGFFTELEAEEDPAAIRKGNNGFGLVAGQITSGRLRLTGAESGPSAMIFASAIANVNVEKNSSHQCSITVLNSPFSGRTYTFTRQVLANAVTTTTGTLAPGAANATAFLTEATVKWQLWEAGTGSLTARVITIDASLRSSGTTCDYAATMYTGGS